MSSQDAIADKPSLERLHLDQPGRRRALLSLVIAALLAAGAWFAIGEAASYPSVLHALGRANVWWLLLALAGAGLGYVGYGLLYQVFSGLGSGPRPSFRVVLRLTVGIFGASVIATSAGRLGAEYWSLRRMREKPAQAWSRVLALNIAAWAVLSAVAALAAAALLIAASHGAPRGVELAWLLLLPACSLPVAWLTSPSRQRWADDQGGRVRRLAASVIRSLVLLRQAVHAEATRGRGAAGGLIYWGGELLILWGALRAFGVGLNPAALVIGYATGYASTILPLPAGGAGGVDAASVYALTLVGVPLSPALLATLVQRIFSYWLPVLIAGASWRSIGRLRTDLAAVPRGREVGEATQ
jgi:uncharacterized membrane protein YbhN (UPF0104 family)